MKNNYLIITISSFLILILLTSCGPLNPVNDFFGIQMNPTDETNFIIVAYNDVDGVSYKNSVAMNPKINAWAEFSANEITVKVINNSVNPISLNYTADQFIAITDTEEHFLGKGERAEYFKKGMISPNASATFNLEYPKSFDHISHAGGTYVDATKTTREVLRTFSKNDNQLNIIKENIKYFIVKLGEISIVLKKVPSNK